MPSEKKAVHYKVEKSPAEILEEKLSKLNDPIDFKIKMVAAIDMEAFGKDLLKAHNNYRKQHHAGPLSMSDKLSAQAMGWANNLAARDVMEHNPSPTYGENIYYCKGFTPSGSAVTKAWYDEIEMYDFKAAQFSMATGHFTAVIWTKTKRIGFGVGHSSSGAYYVVANYDPQGNVTGLFDECVLPMSAKKAKPTPAPTVSGGPTWYEKIWNFFSPFNEFQTTILAAHNTYRATHNSPALKLNKKMCKEAQQWAEHIASINDVDMPSNDISYSQNIFCISGAEPDPKDTVQQWYETKKFYSGRCTSKATPFTSVVWSNTSELGVGVAKSRQGRSFVVAHYYPSGNMMNEEAKNVKNWQ